MAEERVQRKLTTILAADVEGYSRLMSADEEATLNILGEYREIIDAMIARHYGRIFNTGGDSVLAEFPSAVEAVRCAVSCQEEIASRNAELAEERKLVFRIGINVGDVMVRNDDLFGDGVNLAARLEGLCRPGEVYVSGSVHDQVENKLEVSFDDLGQQVVKNFARPIKVYRASTRNEDPLPSGSGEAPPLSDKPSVAVLPFDNISGDHEQEYFSDGITEDIITELSKISGLFVIARHSAFTYKGKSVTLKQVGRELGVRYVLEGSVRKAGNRLRITAQLIDAITDHHLWAERYDRDIEDIFAIQDEVARHVADALAVALKPSEGKRLDRPLTNNIEAYDLYLRTRATPWPPTRENVLSARNAYEHISEIDPTFVGGHAGRALTYAMAVVFGASAEPATDAEIAVSTAKNALALNDGFAQAHSALGLAYLASGKHDQAVASARKAVELQPSDADAHAFLGITLVFAGEGEEAVRTAERALRLDPQFKSGPYLNLLGISQFIAGRYSEAIEAYRRNVAQGGPMGAPMLHPWAAAYVAAGRMEEARETANELLKFFPDFSLKRYRMLHIYKSEEDSQRLIGYLRQAGLPE